MPLSLASLAVAVGAIPGSRLMVAQKGSHVEDALEVLVAAKAPRLVLERPDRRRTGRRALRRGESVWGSKAGDAACRGDEPGYEDGPRSR
jgi:hypothetical protein